MTLYGIQACIVGLACLLGPGTTDHDRDLREAVEDILLDHPEVVPDYVVVKVHDGDVQLSGPVRSLYAKWEAERLAGRVRGVLSVRNDLSILPTGESDAELGRKVSASLAAEPELEGHSLTAAVRSGVVTLTGTAPSRQDLQVAEDAAASVAGVKDVVDHVGISPTKASSDKEIAEEIDASLRWDALVDARDILVQVDHDRVILRGSVRSLAERSRAIADAQVPGVSHVDSSSLAVNPGPEVPANDLEAPDPAVREAVARALARSSLTAPFSAGVEVRNGVVTLRGVAETLRARVLAGDASEQVAGVRHVRNRIRVHPPPGISDRAIEGEIRAAFARDSELRSYDDLKIRVDSGHVLLGGSVAFVQDRRKAEDLASAVPGVMGIDDRLDLGLAPPSLWSERTDEDWKLADHVRSRLYWSPSLDASRLEVAAEGTTVTLRGQLDTWQQAVEAEKIAYEAGARRVINAIRTPGR